MIFVYVYVVLLKVGLLINKLEIMRIKKGKFVEGKIIIKKNDDEIYI